MADLAQRASQLNHQWSRREFFVSLAGATLAFAVGPPAHAAETGAAPEAKPRLEPTIWYHLDADGIVTVNVDKVEMGQHVGTALARIVADELEADWNLVRINYVDSNPKWGFMVTGGSWSISHSYATLAKAGAAGRMLLIDACAKLLGVAPGACEARNGHVRAGRHSVSYADIVRRGNITHKFSAADLDAIPLKDPSQRRLIGIDVPALDIPAKIDGRARYGIDAECEGMIYARPKIPPTRYGSRVTSIDDSQATSVPGYLRTIVLDDPSGTVPGWAMVLAESYPAALEASERVHVDWVPGATSQTSEQDLQARARALIEDSSSGVRVIDDPGIEEAFLGAATTLDGYYTTGSVLHFQLEPVNALVMKREGIWEVHAGNQWQSLILPVLAKALAVREDEIVLRTYLIGGGFGRRLNGDYIVPAALAAKATGKPVKMICTRADDATFDSVRSASTQQLRMAFDHEGTVLAMEHVAAAGWPTLAMAPDLMAKNHEGIPYDQFSISGADHWYSVGAHRVRAITNDLANRAFRPGWLRSVGPGWTNWALESFMDEAAHAIAVDPVEFRLHLLGATGRNAGVAPISIGGAARQANVLRRAAKRAGWGQTMPADTGLGIATTFGQERTMPTWIACVARVHVDRSSGRIDLEKLTLVADAGTIIHPDGARAQVEGAALWGASLALHEGTEFANGNVVDTNLDTYTPLRMADVPDIDIEFVENALYPVGLGEPATTVVGPAIGNAIFAAVGVRLRHIPIRPQDVVRALNV